MTLSNSLLLTIVLGTLAIGLPIFFVLAFRLLWDRSLALGRSKELEKLIWQLHRIASAMEHQMNLNFPAVQPGTEEARDIAYLQQVAAPSAPGTRASGASSQSSAAPVASRPAPQPALAPLQPLPQPSAPQSAAQTQPVAQQQPSLQPPNANAPQPAPPAAEEHPGLVLRDPDVHAPRAGVNSMFGL